ncbi:MAG: DUF3387 domain-containing protein, partial [Candidatus Methanoperedens sp.]|nr:DUF3387 domain-containing protein [Candidatus Methanoperedens sp.]
EKLNGLVVDYVGVFRNLQKALAIYGSGGGIKEGEKPVNDKSVLVEQLKNVILETTAFCTERGIDISKIQAACGFKRVRLIDDAIDAILTSDESKAKYLSMASNVVRIYRAILPDPAANEFGPAQVLIANIAETIRSLAPETDISEVMESVENLLDASIATEGYVIRESSDEYRLVDLSQIDFEALKAQFEKSRKRIEVEKLRGAINRKLVQMVRLNKSRVNYLEKFQRLIDDYNSGSCNVETFFANLVEFAQGLNEEEKRGISENLTEEELAIFDLLIKPEMTLSEQQEVKKVARDLLATLKREKLVLDWRKRQQSRAAVRLSIEEILDRLPRSYIAELYQHKCDMVYQHVYDSYFGQGQSIYAPGS